MKNIILQYILVFLLTLIIPAAAWATLGLFPNIGWYIFTIVYIIIFILQVTFYYLTTNFKIGWSVLSFILNFILWVFEQAGLEKILHDTPLYQNSLITPLILGGLLWANNKILVDYIFYLNKAIQIRKSKLEHFTLKSKNTNNMNNL